MIQLKTLDDILRIKDASKILTNTFLELEKVLCQGLTTKELDSIAQRYIENKGAKPAFLGYFNYPASICISINQEVIHGIPGKRKLETGDIVGIDIGVNFKGFYSDCAMTYPIGNITKQDKKLLDTTKECLYKAIDCALHGNRVSIISHAVYNHAKENGFSVVREYCGHGVGFSLHEDPQIYNYPSNGPNRRLKEGMVIAIEPMINMGDWPVKVLDDGWTVETYDGKKSAHFEHTIAIFKDHNEILTAF